MPRRPTLALLCASALILAACGIKGPLYLPQAPTAPAQPAADVSKSVSQSAPAP
ncbi:LPS translocon maturation chaperone LptM [Niveibacterium sp. 24ML]|uniref:LPS translocon maturation chaperone LptM n=1 Tax=Niveibacterium sp. 24ML TaxID=2985512 RepID=UPI003B63A060